ncbi:MAG: 1,4-alpha-glucan branching protein GlgB [Deltaproteobacteria bacterium]|nr:1,4-alpha-glucan branching protein GlgB [Deltaproteobacteria bacterium]
MEPVFYDFSLLTDYDLYLFNEGSHLSIYEKMGCHLAERQGEAGAYFAVWAPNAHAVYVFGDFNDWDKWSRPLKARGSSGIWEGFLPGITKGQRYKFLVESKFDAYKADKADPFGILHEVPPLTGSVVWDLDYTWGDEAWLAGRAAQPLQTSPMAIYEVHAPSWRRGEAGRLLSYQELAPLLADYLLEMGYTHAEFLPVMEHPFGGSWGYQVTGFFAPTSRQGAPQDFMFLVDHLHQRGLGVILDWVPSHFPQDEHGLNYFDGTHLYEHADPRQGHHPDWDSMIFNYGRAEVRSFLLASACFWLKEMHVDGLRVDAVASMLYLDYSRQDGEWIPNVYGGRENLEAIDFLRRMNTEIYGQFPGTVTIAEESTDWPLVSRPTYTGGLGFGFKWDMGWMHDTLEYFRHEPVHRKFHHNEITFRQLYAFHENFVLALSHDEVVHGKGSLIGKMPGDDWQKFANLRLLYAYMYGQPGKKLLFMGCEFAQWREWNNEGELDWELLRWGPHRGMQRLVADLNRLYQAEPALYQSDHHYKGFEWVDCSDVPQSIISFLRFNKGHTRRVLVVANFTPVVREGYRIGVDQPGFWRESVNTDAEVYGGSGVGNLGGLAAEDIPHHGRPWSLNLTLPPLGALLLQPADQLSE